MLLCSLLRTECHIYEIAMIIKSPIKDDIMNNLANL